MRTIKAFWVPLREAGACAITGFELHVNVIEADTEKPTITLRFTEQEAGALLNELTIKLEIPVRMRSY